MPQPGRLNAGRAVLAVVDVQERLARAMDEDVLDQVVRNIGILAEEAAVLDLPVIFSEQYTRGLGSTVEALSRWAQVAARVEKMHFSCLGAEQWREWLVRQGRRQVILTGMETHVCVLQTAGDLLEAGYEVFLPADAVCSRRKANWQAGLRWMERAGAAPVTTEIAFFDLLKRAGTPEFKQLAPLVR